MTSVLHQNSFTMAGHGQRLATWEGELLPGTYISFVGAEQVPGYSFLLHVAEDADSSENRLAASLEGHEVVLQVQRLKMDYPQDRWFAPSRFVLRYASAKSIDMVLEFYVSLIIDGKNWLDYNLGLKRSDFQDWVGYQGGRLESDREGPFLSPGPWGKLEWWFRERPCLSNAPPMLASL